MNIHLLNSKVMIPLKLDILQWLINIEAEDTKRMANLSYVWIMNDI